MTPAHATLRIADEHHGPLLPDPGEPPEVLTVEEAAAVLRISRNSVYALARRWLATDGAEGLPVVKLGRTLRVPRPALLRILHQPELRPGATPVRDMVDRRPAIRQSLEHARPTEA